MTVGEIVARGLIAEAEYIELKQMAGVELTPKEIETLRMVAILRRAAPYLFEGVNNA